MGWIQWTAAVAVLSCAGCASVSDVVPTGPGTFMVAAHGIDGNGSGAAQKVIALKAAAAHCTAKGLGFQVLSAETVEPQFGRPPSAQVNFKCIGD